MKKFLPILLFIIFCSIGINAQNFNKGFRKIKRHKFIEAESVFIGALSSENYSKKNNVFFLANYGLALNFSDASNPRQDLFKAYTFINIANNQSKNLNSEDWGKIKRITNTSKTVRKLTEIDSLLFFFIKDRKQTDLVQKFIKECENSKYFLQAIQYRNFLEFITAQKQNTIESFTNFINLYPDATQYNEAWRNIYELAFNKAKKEKTIEAFENFIITYPKAPQLNEATENRNSLAFEKVKATNTIEACIEFIKKYPGAKQISKITELRDELAFNRAVNSNTIQSYKKYMDNFPKSKWFLEAKKRFEVLATKIISTETFSGKGSEVCMSSKVDSNGNLFITGIFNSPSIIIGEKSFPKTTPFDCFFFAKIDSAGNLSWLHTSELGSSAIARDIEIDEKGNSYLTGSFDSPYLTFENVKMRNISYKDNADCFIAKYNKNGKLLWTKSYGGYYWDEGKALKVDEKGNVYFCGDFTSNYINFGKDYFNNPGIFLTKLDSLGNTVWTKNIKSSSADAIDLCIDKSNNVYITGNFQSDDICFDKHCLANDTYGSDDFFLAKYDSTGKYLWSKLGTGKGYDLSTSTECDENGNVYLSGYYDSPELIFAGVLIKNTMSNNTSDAFLIKIDNLGRINWAKTIGCKPESNYIKKISTKYNLNNNLFNEKGLSIAIDNYNDVFLVGDFESPCISIDTITLANNSFFNSGMNDVFIVKFDKNGDLLWGEDIGGTGIDESPIISVDKFNNFYITANFQSQVISSIKQKITNSGKGGSNDIFLIKYGYK